jgi:lipoprotein-anchoring transpeptidase ErfK/SrfK
MRLQGRCGHLTRVKTASAAAVVLALGSAPAPASAEGLFSWLFGGQQRFQASPSAPMRAMRYRAAHKSSTHNAQTAIDSDTPTSSTSASKASNGTKSDKAEAVETHGPLFVVVSLNDEHIRVYDDHGLVTSSIVSTGVEGHPTPKGIFTILGRERFHASNLYSGAPMPYMQRVTWSGVAMHVGVVTGHPASHGCIRLPASFAQKIWGMTKIGERVVISPSDISPEGFSSSQLPVAKMYPRAEEAAPAAAPMPVTEAKASSAPDTMKAAAVTSTDAAASEPVKAAAMASTDAASSEGAKPVAPAPAPVVQASAEARPPLNPKEWALHMKAKAVADKAAAVKAAQQAQAAISAQAAESARLANAARVADANLTLARVRSDAAGRAFETAEAALAARHRDATVAMDEPTKSEADPLGGAKTAVLAKALEIAVAAKDSAAQAKTKAEGEVEMASVAADQAHAALDANATLRSELTGRLRDATEAQTAAARAEKDAIQRLAPISVLISKRDHKVYVRQGLAPLFEAPATIREPERPLGTHLFIATGVEKGGNALHWTVLDVPDAGGSDPQAQGRKRRWAQPEEPAVMSHLPRSSAEEALERVELSQDVRDRIAERLWTGGSIIVSDRPVSNETSAVGTDLTVKIR